MKKSVKKTIFITAIMLLIAFGALYFSLDYLGNASSEPIIEKLMPQLLGQQETLGISEQDYIDYPLLKADYGGYTDKTDYLLTPQDAAVLGAKLAEEIFETSYKNKNIYYSLFLTYNTENTVWYVNAFYSQDGSIAFNISIDAVSGKLESICLGVGLNDMLGRSYTDKDTEICTQKALEIAEKYFGFNKDDFFIENKGFEDQNGILIENSSFMINIIVNSARVKSVQMMFALGENKVCYIYASSSFTAS